jgi:hypothetical protein
MWFGFILGFLSGLIVAIGLLGFLVYWLCTRPNQLAVARFINGFANALVTRPKASGPALVADNGKARGRGIEREADDDPVLR